MIAFCVRSIIMSGSMFASFYIYAKSIQYADDTRYKAISIPWCLLWAALYGYAAVFSAIPLALIRPLACLTSVSFVFFLTRQKFETAVSAYLLSFGISLALYYIALIPVSVVSAFFASREHDVGTPLDFNEPIFLLSYTLVFALQIILSILLFRIRRFRKGFPFVFNKYTIVLSLFFTGAILIFVTRVNMIASSEVEIYAVRFINIVGVFIAGVGIYILIRRLIKSYQANKVQQNTESHYEKLYLEEKAKNEELSKQIKAKSSALHNFADRLKATEEAVVQGKAALEDIQRLQSDWEDELNKIKGKTVLPSTNIPAIDNLFGYYAEQFKDERITFNLMINGSVKYMVDNVIQQSELETLIVNHLNDAKKAVNTSESTFRSITAVIGIKENHYEFSVLDSGIPFEIDTLVRLGTERVTTHSDTGGSGIGFETTFQTMQKHNAGLIISEQEQSDMDYSKSVTIRFDGKNQYIIETYRPDDFPESDRYIVTPTTTYAEMT